MYQFTGQGQDLLAQARQLHTDSNDARFRRNYDKAVALLEHAYKLRRTALISPHPILTATVDSIAHLYQEMGRFQEWREYAKVAVEEKVGMLGELHVETQSSLDNLHDACVACGDFDGAALARERSWKAKTSTLGIKDETMPAEGLIGDIERMLEYWRKKQPSIRRTAADDTELESRLRVHDGPMNVDRQAAVAAAQAATNALMNCDFNDRRPVKRDPELEQLLVDRMDKADYLLQFGKAPDPRWVGKNNEVWRDKNGNPGTPPTEDALRAPPPPPADGGGAAPTAAGTGAAGILGVDAGGRSVSQRTGISEGGGPADSLAGEGAPPADDEEGAAPPADDEGAAPPASE